MIDNQLYEAIRQGRTNIPVSVKNEDDGSYTASVDAYGIQVSVKDSSLSWATQEVTRQLLEQVREGKGSVTFQ